MAKPNKGSPFKSISSKEKGQAAVLAALAMTALIGMSALVIDYGSEAVEVICSKKLSLSFARIFGKNEAVISARAVAGKSRDIGPFRYTVFSGDPTVR